MGGTFSSDHFTPVTYVDPAETWTVAPNVFVVANGASAFTSVHAGNVLTNHGYIVANNGHQGWAVAFGGLNGFVLNTANGIIKGSGAGVQFGNAGGALHNFGKIIGVQTAGVFLDVAATIENSGTISGPRGIWNVTPVNSMKITNSGTISGVIDGIFLEPANNLTVTIDNLVGGVIKVEDQRDAIESERGRVVLTNKGTIDGSIHFEATVGNVNDAIINSGRITGVVHLGAGADVFNGGAGSTSVFVFGGDDGDTLVGSKAQDFLSGDGGADTLRGGLGSDLMGGGASRDVFDFDAVAESPAGANRDRIDGFQRSLDDIDLSGIDARTDIAGNQRFAWRGELAFTKVAGQLRFIDQGAKCLVQADVNGDGKADFEISVGALTLGKGDFIL